MVIVIMIRMIQLKLFVVVLVDRYFDSNMVSNIQLQKQQKAKNVNLSFSAS
jgi:thymidylate kinase